MYMTLDGHGLAGLPQPEQAKAALRAMVQEKAAHYEVVLTSHRPNGERRHTLYEFWPAQVAASCLALPEAMSDQSHPLEIGSCPHA